MKLSKNIAVFLMLLPAVFFGQDSEKLLHFKIVADSVSVAGINVVNLINEKSAVSDNSGKVSLYCSVGDLLYFGNSNFEIKRKLIEPADLSLETITIVVIPKITELEEVIVTRTDAPDDLIMRHKDHKEFTPAERKLYTASTGPVDIVANWISGRREMLKKELQVEMNERFLARLEIQFEDDYYIDTLKIPREFIGGFQRYLIEDREFVAALKAKNKTMMQFVISKLAVNYKQLTNIKSE